MIQRIQSLFLLIVAVFSLLLIYLPVYEQVATGIGVGISKSVFLGVLNSAIGILAFLTIFLYKNRRFQIRLCNLGLLITSVFVFLLFFMADTMSSDSEQIHFLFGSYLPLLQLLFLFLASYFIRKDERLVRSADRLR